MTAIELRTSSVEYRPAPKDLAERTVVKNVERRLSVRNNAVDSFLQRECIEVDPIGILTASGEKVYIPVVLNVASEYQNTPAFLCDEDLELKPYKYDKNGNQVDSSNLAQITQELFAVVLIEDQESRRIAQEALYERYPFLGLIAEKATTHSSIRLTNTKGIAAQSDTVDTDWLKCKYSPTGTMHGFDWGVQKEFFGEIMTLASGVRERKETFRELIKDSTEYFIRDRLASGSTKPIRGLDLAAGGWDYGSEGLKQLLIQFPEMITQYLELAGKNSLRFSLSDGSRRAVEYSTKFAKALGVDHLISASLGNAKKIGEMFGGKRKIYEEGERIEMIMSSGFMDYLKWDDKVGFVKDMRSRLEIGGIYANANIEHFDKIPGTNFTELDVLERGVRWEKMYSVDPEELVRLHLEAGFHPDELKVITLPSRRIVMIMAQRIHENPYVAIA
jgi:hypothetical protein